MAMPLGGSGSALGSLNDASTFPAPPQFKGGATSSSSNIHAAAAAAAASANVTPEMEEILRERHRLEGLLSNIELEIYKGEEEYFERTPHGNIVRGWDGVLDNKPPPKRRYEGRERVFSWSSHTFWVKHVEPPLLDDDGLLTGGDSTGDLMGLGGGDDGSVSVAAAGVKRSRSFLTLPSPREPKVVAVKKRKRRAGNRGRADSDDEDEFSVG